MYARCFESAGEVFGWEFQFEVVNSIKNSGGSESCEALTFSVCWRFWTCKSWPQTISLYCFRTAALVTYCTHDSSQMSHCDHNPSCHVSRIGILSLTVWRRGMPMLAPMPPHNVIESYANASNIARGGGGGRADVYGQRSYQEARSWDIYI